MAKEYSVEVCKELCEKFHAFQLYRPMRFSCYDAGAELVYDVVGVSTAGRERVRLIVEKFVGGGFAGQVYRVKVAEVETGGGPIEGLEVGGIYAMKILVPPTGFSRLFRNILYGIGFQGPFQPQTNPAAARAGALWQKFIRRGAKIRFGDESAVVDVHATFVDGRLGSCGEISEWVDGRTWRLEADGRLDLLKLWCRAEEVDTAGLGSPEYRAKRQFMAEFVRLLHEIGAYELARQYEWSTCKSQPNCLKRRETEDDPSGGMVAVDFRAGLALLPFLPMSPGDFKLIAKGLGRGSIVQFDRGSIRKLEAFVQTHRDEFADVCQMLEELKAAEAVYRDSVPDITHNHIRLLYSRRLWATILDSAVTGWKLRNIVDDSVEKKLRSSKVLTVPFFMLGLIPFLGKIIRRIWARSDWRKHYGAMLSSWGYLKRAIRARMAEKVIEWHRAGRISEKRAPNLADEIGRFLWHLPLSLLPAGLHRFLTDREFRKEKLVYIFLRPIRLYFNAHLREQWLREMVVEGKEKHILTDEDAGVILSQINEPYIQRYLISLVVHLLTLPVTQIVSITVAAIYWITHWGQPNAFEIGLGIIGFFQITPISPGSLVRGFYVLYLVIRGRNFKDYNIAVFLGFFKYIGYLAFPIQMAYHYPALARFMAAHWATGAAHIVPVFGERGALLEHRVFSVFYNRPLTIRRRMRKRAAVRATMKPRYWHTGLCAVFAAIVFGFTDFIYLRNVGRLPDWKETWLLVVIVPMFCGSVVTLCCAGAVLWKRIVAATVCGAAIGMFYTVIPVVVRHIGEITASGITQFWMLLVFVFAILSTIGAILTELTLPEPKASK